MKMLNTLLLLVALSAMTTTAFAQSAARAAAERVFDLKDGSTVYIFKDGKMAMEDKYGKATRMAPNVVMETKDGQKIIMHGDEVALLSSLLNRDKKGGGK